MNSNASLNAQRFLVALEHENPDYLRPAARELWYRIWARDEPIHEIQNIKEVYCFEIFIRHPNLGL